MVVVGAIGNVSEARGGCCPMVNFSASTANTERWLAARPQVRGTVITIEDATAAGRAVFGVARSSETS